MEYWTQFEIDGVPNVGDSYTWSGAMWVPTAAPQTGISELRGEVTAGPGTGIQVATIAPTGVTAGAYQMGADCLTVSDSGQITKIELSASCTAVAALTADDGATGLTADDGATALTGM